MKIDISLGACHVARMKEDIPYAPNRTMLYVGGLNYRLDEEAVGKIFGRYGKVLSVHLVLKEEEKKKGIAFVEMKERDHALKAIYVLNGKNIAGRTLRVSVANDRFAAQKAPVKAAPVEKVKSAARAPKTENSPKRNSVPHKGDGRFGLGVLKQYLAKNKAQKV